MPSLIVGQLEIIGVRDAGIVGRERLLLRALSPIKPENYVVVNVKYESIGGITPLNDRVFWFPSGAFVNTGEIIRLYTTRRGSYRSLSALFGTTPSTFHNFYWGSDKPVWGPSSNGVTVFKVEYWNTERI